MAAGFTYNNWQVTHSSRICSCCGEAKASSEFIGLLVTEYVEGAQEGIEQYVFSRKYCVLCSLRTSWDIVAGPDWI